MLVHIVLPTPEKQYQQRQVSARTKVQLIASTAVGDIDSGEGLVKKEATQA